MTDRLRGWIAAAIASLVALYAVLRAAALPITFDEAYTYLAYVLAPLGSLLHPLTSDRPLTANNHILNTLLAKGVVSVLGISEFALRIPNLLALVSYMVFGWRILRRYSRSLPPLIGLVLICVNPFLLDLFSVARGYGLSLGFLMPALYLLQLSLETNSFPRDRGTLVFLLLTAAVLASYVLVNVYAAALLVWLVMAARQQIRTSRPSPTAGRTALETLQACAPVLLVSAGCAAAAVPMILAMREGNALNWGGDTGLWQDTLRTLVMASLYGAPYAAAAKPVLLGSIVVTAAMLGFFLCRASLWRRDPVLMRVFAGTSALTALSVAAIVLEHKLFRVRYPVDRMVVFCVPLFVLSAWLGLEAALRASGPVARRRVRLALVAVCLVGVAHLGVVGGLRKSYLWQFDVDTPAMLADLETLRERSSAGAVRLGAPHFFTPGVDYYRIVRNLTWLAPMNRSGPWGDYDLVYILPSELAEAQSRGYRVLHAYARTGNALCAPPQDPLRTQPIAGQGGQPAR